MGDVALSGTQRETRAAPYHLIDMPSQGPGSRLRARAQANVPHASTGRSLGRDTRGCREAKSRVPGECSECTRTSGTRPGTQRKKREALY